MKRSVDAILQKEEVVFIQYYIGAINFALKAFTPTILHDKLFELTVGLDAMNNFTGRREAKND